MNLKSRYIGLAMLVFGITLVVLSYPNLYSWNVQFFDSTTLLIGANSSNEHSMLIGVSNVKRVQVIVDNGPWGLPSAWGDCYWINHPFEISLLNGEGDSVGITTAKAPSVDYTFDVPSSWSHLGGIRISNPENQPVAVNIIEIFHNQTLNSSWEMAIVAGLIVILIGIILMVISTKKGRNPPSPSH